MAVKATSAITLSTVVDVTATFRYYLLQSSTLNPPSKPTSKPPGGNWTDTEPAYTSGSTNTLYFTDLTVFSDGTWSYSSVSRSSSYEAAKEAYNRAIAAQTAAAAAQAGIDGLQIGGENLYIGTRNFSGDRWLSNGVPWWFAEEQYNGFNAFGTTYSYTAYYQNVSCKAGDVFTLSAYIWRRAAAGVAFMCANSDKHGTIITSQIPTAETYTRISISFTAQTTGEIHPSFATTVDGQSIRVCALKLERGNRATDWTPAPEDDEERLELKLENVHTRISETSDTILQEVQAKYALSTDMIAIVQQLTTLYEQTESGFSWGVAKVSELESDLRQASTAAETQLAQLHTYMTFTENGLVIGKTGNPFSFRVVNDRLAFYMNETEVAYLSNNKLYVTQAEILRRLQIGKFAFEPQSNGNLSVIYTQ